MLGLDRKIATILALSTVALAYLLIGCSPSDELGGVELINALPDTRITGKPPVLEQTEITVEFSWSGSDADGSIIGYLWKMSSNSTDGISVYDTLTVDPASGDTINPWYFTEATDSIFVVTADSSGFQPDMHLPEESQRYFQPHTFFVRAVDDKNQVDPTPALITFTATTIAPTITINSPSKLAVSYKEAQALPPTFTLGWEGRDPDFLIGTPTKVRYLLKKSGNDVPPIVGEAEFELYKDQLISFNDPEWSDWIPYYNDAEDRRQTFKQSLDEQGAPRSYYLFAIQAQDTAGAKSLELTYAKTVHVIYMDGSKTPILTLREQFLGQTEFNGLNGYRLFDIAQGQLLEFDWIGTAQSYGGEIAGYRFGWDVDPNDENDPNWEVSMGNTPAHRETQKVWASGLHTLYVECYDTSDQRTLVRWDVSVVPVPQGNSRSPLLLIDDVIDESSQRWQSAASGGVMLYQDVYRDAFWARVIEDDGGVKDFIPGLHIVDTQKPNTLSYRQAVEFDVLLWTTNRSDNFIHQNFDPGAGTVFVWLETYMKNVGNLFMVGSASMRNFHDLSPLGQLWMFPIIYDSTEGAVTCSDGANYALSFGTRTDEETDEVTIIGRERFPYRALGISMIDLMSPPVFMGRGGACRGGTSDRSRQCVGTKAVILNREFKDKYINAGVFADTIYTDPKIDWKDIAAGIPSLNLTYTFGEEDEMYDYNVSGRASNWSPQYNEDGTRTVEPMWHVYSRYDWWLDLTLANGGGDLVDPLICGSEAIDPRTKRSKVDGAPIGVVSHKSKPDGPPDVIWGFDPYRMDNDEMLKAVRWVLGEHFGLTMK